MINKILIFSIAIILSSCADYVKNMHKNFDAEYAKRSSGQDKFKMYRKKAKNNSLESKYGKKYQSSSSKKRMPPKVRRNYSRPLNTTKRYTAKDLIDNKGNTSLWISPKGAYSLYTADDKKGVGDIVLVKVMKGLKTQITNELKRAFPASELERLAKSKSDKGAAGAVPKEDAKAAPSEGEDQNKVYDKISTIINEEINDSHVLLKGRKTLIYKNVKRIIELQALVFKKDIEEKDSVLSNEIIDSTVTVIR
jgi:flagellar basal body L-ring protein FlgH